MIRDFFKNTKKPRSDLGGKIMLKMMNFGHNKGSLWALQHTSLKEVEKILDIGCGGGRNIDNLLKLQPVAHITGLDYSEASVLASKKYNQKAIEEGRVTVLKDDVANLSLSSSSFDLVTAFETVYFWEGPELSFQQVFRVLKPSGSFLIFNELGDPEKGAKWVNMIGMNLFTGSELKEFLEVVGFEDVKLYEHENGRWICLVARRSLQA